MIKPTKVRMKISLTQYLQTEYKDAVQQLLKYAIILTKNGWRVEPNDIAEDLSQFSVRKKTHEEEITLREQYEKRKAAAGKMVVELLDTRPSNYRGTSDSRNRLLQMAESIQKEQELGRDPESSNPPRKSKRTRSSEKDEGEEWDRNVRAKSTRSANASAAKDSSAGDGKGKRTKGKS